jgi:hypothetical protein
VRFDVAVGDAERGQIFKAFEDLEEDEFGEVGLSYLRVMAWQRL